MEPDLRSKILGILFSGTSGVCFACASLFVKLCGDVPIPLILLVRSLVQIASSTTLNLVVWKQDFSPKDKVLGLCGFGVLGFLTIYGFYFSFQTIPLGEATVVISTCPIFVAVMDRVIYKTPISVSTVMSGVVCSVGVVILTHSSAVGAGDHGLYKYIMGYGVITLATITQAATFILFRQINVHFVVPVFYLGVSNTVLSLLIGVPQLVLQHLSALSLSGNQWAWLLLVSAFAVIGSFTLNMGLQYEQIAMVALVRNIDIATAYFFDVIIFQHSFSWLSLIGSSLVVMATIGSGLVAILQETQQYRNLTCEPGRRMWPGRLLNMLPDCYLSTSRELRR